MAAAIRLSQQHSCSFDHLIGGGEQLVRHGETEHPGRLSVDDKLKLGRLHDRQLCRLRAFEDAASIDPRLTPRICLCCAAAGAKYPRPQKSALKIARREPLSRRPNYATVALSPC